MKPFPELPIVEEITPMPDVEETFCRLSGREHCLFLDSALGDPVLGRYSFVSADPVEFLELPGDVADALGQLTCLLAPWRNDASSADDLPPFLGGVAGLLGYDLGRQLERLPRPAFDEFRMPVLAVGLYDVVIAFDHVDRRAWIASQGIPETEPSRRFRRARKRIDEVRHWLAAPVPRQFPERRGRLPPLTRAQLAPQSPVRGLADLTSNMSESAYLRAVERAIDYVYAGDVFQVNLAQRLLCPVQNDSVSLYLRLRRCNPAPFAGYFDLGDFQVISASPERFLSVRGGEVETRPIKGTRPRPACGSEAEAISGDELQRSEKDRAENVMIVDLLRNDLSRVCQPASIRVSQLCGLETYAYVQHLVSVVHGRLGNGLGPIDLIRAAFPGGSVTGAPKVRAMEIIAELEPTARGAYCGSLGYWGLDGALDLNLLIRTVTAGRGWWQTPVGGGIVAQSVPRQEYEETWTKAEGLLRAFG